MSQWISTNERIPEHVWIYLVVRILPCGDIVRDHCSWCGEKVGWYHIYDKKTSTIQKGSILYWLEPPPIPELLESTDNKPIPSPSNLFDYIDWFSNLTSGKE